MEAGRLIGIIVRDFIGGVTFPHYPVNDFRGPEGFALIVAVALGRPGRVACVASPRLARCSDNQNIAAQS